MLIAIVGLFFTVGRPVINLNTSITKLTVTVEQLQRDYDDLKKRAHEEVNDLAVKNSDSHRRIHDKLDDHEQRITDLEHSH
ncbi:DUF948 domain-containing protein [Holdemania sp. 1001302B_160321_E10]|uniref:DUF948 domain-containing protein n=1 Tax=Holdemania sp. 1001302B_160321_E10 TaxID=2787120 RepID=UPI00189B27CC|nr:DUF948 domain-containing protein [Holdemania sp. 1001302B_160321_E10]